VFFVDDDDRVCVICADGTGSRVLVNQPTMRFEFMFSPRLTTAVWWDRDRTLHAGATGSDKSRVVQANGSCGVDEVDLSANEDLLALIESKDSGWRIRVVDLQGDANVPERVVEGDGNSQPDVAWDARDPSLLWCFEGGRVRAFLVGPAGLLEESRPGPNGVVRNLRAQRPAYRPETQGDLVLRFHPGREVARGEERMMGLPSGLRGFIGIGIWRSNAAFLSSRGQVIFQAERFVYVGDAFTRKIAPLVEGVYLRMTPDRSGEKIEDWLAARTSTSAPAKR
jgi:hypothetical protein